MVKHRVIGTLIKLLNFIFLRADFRINSIFDKGKHHISFWILRANDIDAHKVYVVISPLIKDFIEKNGRKYEIRVGNKGEEKKVYIIEYK